MATQSISGLSGKVYISNDGGSTWNAIAEVRNAKVKIKQAEIEVTSMDSGGWAEYIPGPKEWEAETEELWIPANVAQSNLFNALVQGQTIKLRLLPKLGTGNTGYTGDAFISEWELEYATDDAVVLSASFRGTGALATYTAP